MYHPRFRFFAGLPVAWLFLIHEKKRSALAVGGIFVALLLMFLQIGFYTSVPKGGLLFYDVMKFDLMLTSSNYVFEGQPMTFPRRRLFQALSVSEISNASAVYHGSGRWLNNESSLARDVFVIGYNPDNEVFGLSELRQAAPLLRLQDTILIDGSSRPEIGTLQEGRRVEIEQRTVTIGGKYNLGIGFVGMGVAVASELNFARIFPNQGGVNVVNLGLLTLKPGNDANVIAARLRAILPPDTRVFTRAELTNHEVGHWASNTSTGLIFGFGVVVAIVVGLVILSQTLSAEITRQLPQYATLKAIGYSDRDLGIIVLTIAAILATVSYVPAAILSVVIYDIVQNATPLPIEMTAARMLGVLTMAWVMASGSALVALRVLRRADPAELF